MERVSSSISERTYYSRKDAGIGIILWSSILGGIGLTFFPFDLSSFIISVLIASIVGYIWLGTRYIITGDQLIVKAGPFHFAPVPVGKIMAIRSSRTWLAAPACSLDRIVIEYGRKKEIIISPKEMADFIAALKRVNPKIRIEQSGSASWL